MSHITHKKAYYVIHSFCFSKRVTLLNGSQESDIPRMIKLLCQAVFWKKVLCDLYSIDFSSCIYDKDTFLGNLIQGQSEIVG